MSPFCSYYNRPGGSWADRKSRNRVDIGHKVPVWNAQVAHKVLGVSAIDDLAARARSYFERINQEVFAGDPATNPNLTVEMLSSTVAHDTPALVLITPWTVIGLAFPPDDSMPSTLRIGASHYTVIANEVAEIGPYFSILLVPDVTGYSTQDELIDLARPLADKLKRALEKFRVEATQVEDEDRRALFRAMRGTSSPGPRPESPFGSPDGPAISSPET